MRKHAEKKSWIFKIEKWFVKLIEVIFLIKTYSEVLVQKMTKLQFSTFKSYFEMDTTMIHTESTTNIHLK